MDTHLPLSAVDLAHLTAHPILAALALHLNKRVVVLHAAAVLACARSPVMAALLSGAHRHAA